MSLFLDKTADAPAFRILEYFLEARETDHAVSDIIEAIGISRSTFYTVWPNLLENRYVILRRTVGKTNLFVLNVQNPYVQAYLSIFERALKERGRKPITVKH